MKWGRRLNFELERDKRWFILLILVISIFIGYMARMSVSVALPSISEEFGWSIQEEGTLGGLMLGIFLVSYGFSNLVFSRYIDVFGSKPLLLFSIVIWSISILIAALFPYFSVIVLSRVLLGIAQGVLFPIASKIVSNWFSPKERAKANSIFVSGGPWAVMLSPVILIPIITAQGWRTSFFFIFLIGLLLLLPVFFFVNSSPKNVRSQNIEIKDIDYLSILKERQFQILLIGYTLMSSVWWGLSLWLPTYLVESKGLELEQISYGASIPYVGAVLGMYLGSFISDKLRIRKKLIIVALSFGGLFLFILVFFGGMNIYLVLILLVLVFFSGQMAPPLYFTILQEKVTSEKMGSATGVMNGVGNGLGLIGPMSVGILVTLTGSYDIAFSALGIMLLIGGISLLWYES